MVETVGVSEIKPKRTPRWVLGLYALVLVGWLSSCSDTESAQTLVAKYTTPTIEAPPINAESVHLAETVEAYPTEIAEKEERRKRIEDALLKEIAERGLPIRISSYSPVLVENYGRIVDITATRGVNIRNFPDWSDRDTDVGDAKLGAFIEADYLIHTFRDGKEEVWAMCTGTSLAIAGETNNNVYFEKKTPFTVIVGQDDRGGDVERGYYFVPLSVGSDTFAEEKK